jgi:DNA-binding PadR family transcriptional regulator
MSASSIKSFERTTTVESLLGVLSLGPKSGYQMRHFIEQSTGNFWTESFGQIYPALKQMLSDGLVEVASQEGAGPTAKRVYRITEAGREHLRAWLEVPTRPQVRRHELLLKVFFSDQVEAGVVAQHVQAEHRRHAESLAKYVAKLEMLERDYASHPGLPFWRMTLRYGMAESRMVMAWCEETLQELGS